MPEYLAPGVYIEELPGQRTIEGVSTSVAGFVGMTERGPIEGPPVLVTSFGQFAQQFGGYLQRQTDANGDHGLLPIAVEQFFDNGGQMAFVVRAYKQLGSGGAVMDTDARALTLSTGVVVGLTTNAPVGVSRLQVSSLRGYDPAALPKIFMSDGHALAAPVVTDAAAATNELLLGGALGTELRAGTAYVQMIAPAAAPGPKLTAREPGLWGESVGVQAIPVRGTPIALAPGASIVAAAGAVSFAVASASTLYVGATITIWETSTTSGAPQNTSYATVTAVAGNVVTVDGAGLLAGHTYASSATVTPWVALAEIEIQLRWATLLERFRGSWRYVAPAGTAYIAPADVEAFNDSHSVWQLIQNGSTLVSLDVDTTTTPPSLKVGTPYVDATPLTSHPTTPNGYPAPLKPQGAIVAGTADKIPDVPAYLGSAAAGPGKRSGIAALTDEETIAIVAVPGVTAVGVQSALITHCETLRYRFAVLDGPNGASIAAIRAHRSNYDTEYAALYYPWLQITDPESGDDIWVPPSGAVIGIYARTDVNRGVFKAPANEDLANVTDVQTRVLTGDQEILNPEGINVIRDFRKDNRGIRVWGARTLSSDSQWMYVSVRRLFIFLENSIDNGSQWVVFEPNNQDLWARVKRTVTVFLEAQWKTGALFGATAADAFYVKCDRSTMTLDDIANGRLVVEIGIAPTRPAEFVIFRITQLTADASQN